MSMVNCSECDKYIDSDFDCDCFVEVGNMRRMHKTIVLCEVCRDARNDRLEWEQSQEPKGVAS